MTHFQSEGGAQGVLWSSGWTAQLFLLGVRHFIFHFLFDSAAKIIIPVGLS